jgi:hypothetical protein
MMRDMDCNGCDGCGRRAFEAASSLLPGVIQLHGESLWLYPPDASNTRDAIHAIRASSQVQHPTGQVTGTRLQESESGQKYRDFRPSPTMTACSSTQPRTARNQPIAGEPAQNSTRG